MQVSEQFLKIIRRCAVSAILIAVAMFAFGNFSHAQNAGTVGIYTYSKPVFTNQTSSAHSAIFNDIGQGLSILTICNSGFSGTVDLEWKPQGGTQFLPLQIASYTLDSGCPHTLVVGGYYPNLRSSVTLSAGNTTVNYTASAAPVPPVAAGMGSNGATSPPVCDQSAITSFSNGVTGSIAVQTPATNQITVICGFSVSYAAAPTGGNVNINWVQPLAPCSGGSGLASWSLSVPSGTIQPIIVPILQRSPSPYVNTAPCFTNNSGAAALVTVQYANISAT